jgi:hypothetical protein
MNYRDFRDPRWIVARFPGRCPNCQRTIARGDSAFYFPCGRRLFCDGEACGKAAARRFECEAQDEAAFG